jgi:hypothetical protein
LAKEERDKLFFVIFIALNKYMKKYLLLAGLVIAFNGFGQTIVQRDREIEQMVKEVSADSMKAYIQQLVTFGTRNTLSTVTDKKKGIGAAREWVVRKFTEFGKQSNGRLTAYVDTTTLPADGRRVDVATSLGNAMAILKGTDPNDDRIYLISGHLDSRVTDVMNRTADAPGSQ